MLAQSVKRANGSIFSTRFPVIFPFKSTHQGPALPGQGQICALFRIFRVECAHHADGCANRKRTSAQQIPGNKHEATVIDKTGKALLDQAFPEYDSLFSDTFGVTSKEVPAKYPAPEDLLNVIEDSI